MVYLTGVIVVYMAISASRSDLPVWAAGAGDAPIGAPGPRRWSERICDGRRARGEGGPLPAAAASSAACRYCETELDGIAETFLFLFLQAQPKVLV